LHLFLVSEHWLSGTKMQCFASEHWAIGHEDAIFCQRTLGYRARGCIGFASDNWAIGHDDAIFCQRTLGVRTQRCNVVPAHGCALCTLLKLLVSENWAIEYEVHASCQRTLGFSGHGGCNHLRRSQLGIRARSACVSARVLVVGLNPRDLQTTRTRAGSFVQGRFDPRGRDITGCSVDLSI
jgi:hypothetical protein